MVYRVSKQKSTLNETLIFFKLVPLIFNIFFKLLFCQSKHL